MQVYFKKRNACIIECRNESQKTEQTMTKKYTSLRVSEATKMKLERVAIDVSYETKESVKWTDVANFLFDQYLNEAKSDMIHKKRS